MADGNQANYGKIGFTLVLGIVCIVAALIWFGGAGSGKRFIPAETYFTTPVSGLAVGSDVCFRGVKIGRNATVKNSIIMQDTIVGDGAFLNCVITDKNAVIRDQRMLAGAETQPFYVSKGKMI